MTNCPSCGNSLAPDARFCPRCGASLAIQSQPLYTGAPAGRMYSRVQRHIQITGILWIVYATERVFSGVIGMLFLHGIFGRHFHDVWGNGWATWGTFGWTTIWPLMVGSIAIGVVLALITAYALLTRQPWGRTMAIVASILALMHPIFGTVLGIYTLCVFASYASGVEYASMVRTPQP
jgi:ABC-type glycerol-3-phosphate transport system permease component